MSNGDSAIKACEKKRYDLVLCDYELGSGKNGQQVLEYLREKSMLDSKSVFIVISGNAERDVVMSVYDTKPDDYLAKPINSKILKQRIDRQLSRVDTLRSVYSALDDDNVTLAIKRLEHIVQTLGASQLPAIQLLGELYLDANEFDKAKALYEPFAKESRHAWAEVGLARALLGLDPENGQERAANLLDKVIERNPYHLPAYDALIELWSAAEAHFNAQHVLQRCLDASPRSLKRQQQMAHFAQLTHDYQSSLKALKKAIKLGNKSVYSSCQDNFNFARITAMLEEHQRLMYPMLPKEARQLIEKAAQSYELTQNERAQSQYLACHLEAIEGDESAKRRVCDLHEASLKGAQIDDLQTNIDHLNALYAVEETERAEHFIHELITRYALDESKLEKLDIYLREPISQRNQERVAHMNRFGIELYDQQEYAQAVDHFEQARIVFPKHIGIQLNVIQSMIMYWRQLGSDDDDMLEEINDLIREVEEIEEKKTEHLESLSTLRSMLESH